MGVDELKGRGLGVNDVVIVRGSVGTADGKVVERSLGWGQKEQLALHLKYSETMYSNDSYNLKKNNYSINIREVLKSCTLDGSNKITLWT